MTIIQKCTSQKWCSSFPENCSEALKLFASKLALGPFVCGHCSADYKVRKSCAGALSHLEGEEVVHLFLTLGMI